MFAHLSVELFASRRVASAVLTRCLSACPYSSVKSARTANLHACLPCQEFNVYRRRRFRCCHAALVVESPTSIDKVEV